jgi:hypothetical protein
VTTHTELLREAREFIDDLLERCEGELYTAVDLETREPNPLGLRALRLAERLDAALVQTSEPAPERTPGIVDRVAALLRIAR